VTPAEALRAHPLFADFSEVGVGLIGSICELRRFPAGDPLFQAGMPGDAVFFILSGRAKVFVMTVAGEQVLGELGAGDSVGDMALLSPGARLVNVSAIDDLAAVYLPAGKFLTLAQSKPQACLKLMLKLAQRLGENVRAIGIERLIERLG
jgi:CRP-like cAMP-binding protein